MTVLEELSHVGGKLTAGHEVGAGPNEAEEAKGGLLPNAGRGGLGEEDVLHFNVKTLDQLEAGDVGNRAQGQGLGDVGFPALARRCPGRG